MISYEELLRIFWQSHDASSDPYSRQYMSAVFPMTDEQEETAQRVKKELEEQAGYVLQTAIIPLDKFYMAEEYHQKYYLQARSNFMLVFREFYPSAEDWINSTAAARVNGYWSGYGKYSRLMEEKELLNLPEELFLELEDHVRRLSSE